MSVLSVQSEAFFIKLGAPDATGAFCHYVENRLSCRMAQYHKRTKINSGGFGVVYKAERVDAGDAKVFALKELAKPADNERKRFVREVRIQAKLTHENIMPILAHDLSVDPPWFVMPLARANLRDELPGIVGKAERIANVFQQILDGIVHAHNNGVVHRDLKPENILLFEPGNISLFADQFVDQLQYDGVVKIGDFGLGKRLDFESVTITRSSENMGTVAYMPPEQFDDFKHVDQRGDIYSLGKILYEMFTGRLPIHVDPKHPRIPDGYGVIISKCLEQVPKSRYQSTMELSDDFRLVPVSLAVQTFWKIMGVLEIPHSQRTSLIDNLDALFRTLDGNEAFYRKLFPRLSASILIDYHKQLKHNFHKRFRKFNESIGRFCPFNYTDALANFYKTIHRISDENEVRILVERRLQLWQKSNLDKGYIKLALTPESPNSSKS